MPKYDVVVEAEFEDEAVYTNIFENEDESVIAIFENEYDDRYTLSVEQIETTTELQGENVVKLYDIKLLDKDGNPVTVVDTEVEVKIPLTEELKKYDNIKVVYINEGIEEEVTSKIENGYIIFTTTHLSKYGIQGTNNVVENKDIEKKDGIKDGEIKNEVAGATNTVAENKDTTPKTGDNMVLIVSILILASTILVISLKKKSRH